MNAESLPVKVSGELFLVAGAALLHGLRRIRNYRCSALGVLAPAAMAARHITLCAATGGTLPALVSFRAAR